jgi:hypothetical protein
MDLRMAGTITEIGAGMQVGSGDELQVGNWKFLQFGFSLQKSAISNLQ